jgi:hypothetical protein
LIAAHQSPPGDAKCYLSNKITFQRQIIAGVW